MACHRRVVFLFAILCCWSGVAAAQFGDPPARRVSRPRPTTPTTPAKPAKPAQGLGQLVVQDAQSDSPVRLNVARYHAHVVLQPPAALVQIDQSFYNPYDRQEEGTFVFSLPRGASVSRFAMYVTPGQLVEGEMVERQRAASVYQTIVSRRRDPAILEQIGENLFKMRVFPIPPKDTKRILLDYTIPLESSAGECRFRLPLFSDLEPIWDFRLTGVIRAAVRTDGATSPSHPAATFKRDADGTVRFELTGQNYKPESDFLLSFAEQSTLEPAVRVCAVEPSFEPPFDGSSAARRKPGGLYFQATLPHDADPAAAKDVHGKATPPADVLVLVDTSTSMRDCPLVRQKLGEVLHKLRPADRFRVACVDVGARPLDDRWQKSGGPEVEKALGRFDQEFCLGGTDFDVALAEATALFDEKSPRRRLVICLGDGGQTDAGDKVNVLIGRLANRLQDAHAPLVAVLARGSEKGQMLMDWLARESGGLVFDLVGSAIAERDLDAWLSSGLPSPEQIVKVEVEGAEPDDLYYPTAWLPDRALHVFGRVGPREKLRLTVTTADDGKPLERKWELAVDPKQDDVFVGRLWAQRKLDTLRRQRPFPKPEDPDDVLKKQMIALSQEWSLLSPYTAFLVLESEEDYARWEIDRRRRHRYWKPADAQEPEQLPEEWTRRAAERVKQSGKESDEKRLARTIRSAREALEGGNPSLADRLLDAIRNVPEATQSSEYTEMKRRAMAGIQREAVLGALGPCRALLDPATATPEPALDARLLPSLLAVPSASDDFGRRHPYAKQLLEEVPVRSRPWRPRKDRLVEETIFTVDELAAMLARDPSVNVVVDRRALENTRISTARELGVYGFGRMSLRDYARFLLGQAGLVLVEEPHRLLITTEDEAETRTTTEVYPVADLLIPDRVADPSLLFDPYLDHRLAAESRIRAKLQRPIDVEFDKTPLAEVVKKLGEILDGAVLVDEKSLEEDGFAFETPLTARWRGMPVKESLRWTLRDMNLTYIIRGGALVITTPDRALERLETRLHSGRGVLYEYAAPAEDRSRPGRSGGFTGGMGGMAMGSMGMGGMAMGAGGGVGAGMGGFAGGGFGMGGGLGVPQQGSAAGLSSGGDATVPNEAEASEPGGASMPESSGIDRPRPDTSLTLQASQRQEYTHDFDSLIELVTTTIKPASWDDLGGPGSIAFFEPTLDFVLTATEEVHDEIDVLFDRLRKLPQVSGARGWRPATLQPVDPDAPLDFDGLIGLLTSSIRPVSWDEVGGVGSVTFDEPRAVLIVSQTRDTQDEVSNMLTMLRRSRYEMLRGDRPWERKGLAAERPLVAPWPEADNPPPRLSAMPEPKSAELASLGDRQVESGLWEWRRSVPGKSGSQSIVLRRQGDRIEILLPGCVLRAEGDAVAIAWPGLRLVELGNWGEEVRRLADRRLPWLPHRANDELARLFHVTKTDAGRVRLVPAGLSEDANTWLEAEFAGPSRFPRLWQTQLDGKPTGRLRLDGKTAVMEDAADKVLARWELIRSETGDVEVPPLEADWQGYVRLDRRSEEPAVDRPVAEAVGAMARSEWPEAVGHLGEALKTRPRQPLLLLLTAWCYEQDARLGSREQEVALLEDLARQGLRPLAREVNEGNFPSLSPAQHYAILSALPAKTLTAADRDRLSGLAAEAGRLDEALAHAQAALSRDKGGRRFERHRAVVGLLLKLERAGEAEETARRWAASSDPTPEQRATMAELLARHGRQPVAEELFVAALGAKYLAPERRFGLLCRRAAVAKGRQRWDLLLEAARIVPAESPARDQCLDTIDAELVDPSQAEAAAQLAAAAKDPRIKASLLLAEARLHIDPKRRAEAYWQVYKLGWLSDDLAYAACYAWNSSGEPRRVIEFAETRLRNGKGLSLDVSRALETAYRAAGRERDARRAAPGDPEPTDRTQGSPARDAGQGGGMF